MAYLQQWLDPELQVGSESAEVIARAEIERLSKMKAVATAAAQIPRRIGAEADGEELAADKRRCKRIAHVAEQSIKAWGLKEKPPGDVSREAAQVNWDRWWADHRTWLMNRMRYIATWQYRNGTDERWAKSALVKLNNELSWTEYAMR